MMIPLHLKLLLELSKKRCCSLSDTQPYQMDGFVYYLKHWFKFQKRLFEFIQLLMTNKNYVVPKASAKSEKINKQKQKTDL